MSILRQNISDQAFFFAFLSVALSSAFILQVLTLSQNIVSNNSASVLASTTGGEGELPTPVTQPTKAPPTPTPIKPFEPTPVPTNPSQPTQIPTQFIEPTTFQSQLPTPTPDIPNLVVINPSTTPLPPQEPLPVLPIGGMNPINITDPNLAVQVETRESNLTISVTDRIVPSPIPGSIASQFNVITTQAPFSLSSFFGNLIGNKQTTKFITTVERKGFITHLPNFPFTTQIQLENSSLESINTWLDPYEGHLSAGQGSETYITRLGVTVATDLPVRLSLSRRSLSLLTPVGETKLVYLPDFITSYLKDRGVVHEIGGHPISLSFGTAFAQDNSYPIYLGWKKDRLIYSVRGTRQQFAFAFLPVSIEVIAEVDARTRDLIHVGYNSRIEQILDIISI